MFIDTNVLVNSRIAQAPHHEIAKECLSRAFDGNEPLRISRQVVRGIPICHDTASDLVGCHHA